MATESIGKLMLSMAIPSVIAQIINILYSIVDRIYIGHIEGVGMEALTGVGVTFPIITLISAFSAFVGVGGAPLASIWLGKGDRKRAETILGNGVTMLAAFTVLLMVVFYAFQRPLLYMFGASDATIDYAVDYISVYLVGTIFVELALGLNTFIISQGQSRIAMMAVLIGAVANIVLDPIFIFVFHLGVRGAALATICSQILSAVFVVRFLTGKRAELRISLKRKPSFGKRRVLDIVGLGSASFVMQCTNSLVQIACNRMLGAFGGDVYISTMTIINSVRQILDTPVLAIADGASPILSYNYGAKRYDNVKKAIRFITLSALVYTGATWVLILLFPEMFIGIFNNDDSLLTVAVPALHIYFFAFIFQALQYSGQTVFKSLNKKKQAIFFSLLRKVVIVAPLTFFLPYVGNLGANGVFVAEPVSNFLGGSACFLAMILTVMPELGGRRKEQRERTD